MNHCNLVDLPKISVIIPCYNSGEYISATLESLFSQTYKNIEVIAVDDSSTDKTSEILRSFQEKYGNLTVVFQSEHQNAGACRNVGIKYATGEYVHFLDADDWLVENAYETVLRKVQSKKVDACIFQYRTYDNKTGKLSDVENVMTKQDQKVSLKEYPDFLIYGPVMPWNKLIKKKLIDDNCLRFDEIECANDRSFYFKLIKASKRILVIPDKLIFYRVNNSGSLVGSGRTKNFEANFKAFESSLSAYYDANPKIRNLLIDAYVRDFFYFFKTIPEIKKPEVRMQLARFFSDHRMLFDKGSKMYTLIEEIDEGKYEKIDEFVPESKKCRFVIFSNGIISGLKLLFLKIKDKLSRRSKCK